MKYFTFDNIYKVASLGGIICIMWLNSHYVTIERFETFTSEQVVLHTKITEAISSINTSLVLLQNNSKQLEDHESRIRILEHENK